jgi:hypothetical protein
VKAGTPRLQVFQAAEKIVGEDARELTEGKGGIPQPSGRGKQVGGNERSGSFKASGGKWPYGHRPEKSGRGVHGPAKMESRRHHNDFVKTPLPDYFRREQKILPR